MLSKPISDVHMKLDKLASIYLALGRLLSAFASPGDAPAGCLQPGTVGDLLALIARCGGPANLHSILRCDLVPGEAPPAGAGPVPPAAAASPAGPAPSRRGRSAPPACPASLAAAPPAGTTHPRDRPRARGPPRGGPAGR
jgi:hypothetical protein